MRRGAPVLVSYHCHFYTKYSTGKEQVHKKEEDWGVSLKAEGPYDADALD